MGYILVKLASGEIVTSAGDMVFRKLSSGVTILESIKCDLNALGLSLGEHTITVTATAAGLESEHSNTVIYEVK